MLTDLTIYAYGNGDFIGEILISSHFFFKNATAFFKISAMLSLLIFMFETTGLMPNRGMDWGRFIRMYVIMAIFVLTPYPGKLTVHDVITNQDKVLDYEQKTLPYGMVVPIAICSTMIHELIKSYQDHFEIDENLNYTYSGMNFGANFIQSLDDADSYDPNFNYNLRNYMQNCGFPLLNKAGALSQLRNSSDIFATLKQYTSDARFVQQVDFSEGKTNVVVSCSDAIDKILEYYNKNANKIVQNNANRMGVSDAQYQRFLTSANATSSQLLKISQGASDAMKQAIAQNMIMASLKSQAQSIGNGTLALAAYDAEAFQEYKQASFLSGAAAARSAPITAATMFALLMLLYPIMIFLAITMGSYQAVKEFFQLLVAVNLIPLLFEIFNYITTFYLQKKLGTLIVGQGYTYDISASIYSFTDNMIISCNWLIGSTPIIAYAIVSKSSNAFTSIFSHINDPAKSRAESEGNELAKGIENLGNVNLDNASFNNVHSNKLDDQLSLNSGDPMIKTVDQYGTNTNIGGQNYADQFNDHLNTGVNIASSASHSLENRLSQSRDQSRQLSQQWGQSAQRAHELANSYDSGQGYGQDIGTEDRNALNNIQELSLSIQAGLSSPKLFGASVGTDGRSSATDNLNNTIAKYNSYREQLSHSSNQAIRDTYSGSDLLSSSTSNLISDVTSTSRALSDVKSNSATVNSDFTHPWADSLREQGINPMAPLTEEQHATATAFASQQLEGKYGIKDNLQSPSTHTIPAPMPDAPNNKGLVIPSDVSSSEVGLIKSQARANEKINNFNENPGNVAGNQVVEQAKTGAGMVKNFGQLVKNDVKKYI